MAPFRDEQVALMERVARLEDELRERRGVEAERARAIEELRELTKRIELAGTRVDPDRAELDKLSAAVARLQASTGNPDAAAPASENEKETEAAPSRNPGLVLALVAAAAVLAGVLVFVSNREPPPPKVTKPTDPTSLAEARLEASKAGLPASGQLLKMKAWYVSPDGMLHASPAYSPHVDYVFAAPPKPASSAPPRPIGAPEDPTTMFENEYAVTLTLNEARVEQTFMIRMQGAVPDPHCRLADIWKVAQAAGAPAEAVAIIEYAEAMVDSRGMKGDLSRVPHWHFEIASKPPFKVDVSDRDCALMR